jgi:NAD(P)H-flavin reductase
MAAPRKVKARVTGIRRFEGNVTHYTLSTEVICRFKPGQFLHLAIDAYDPSFNWPESRVFSIANAPEGGNEVEILISPKGNFTQRMVSELKIGSDVWIKLPFGIFNFDATIDKNVVLIAGGTGISPFLSFLSSQLSKPSSYKSLKLYYGVRNPDLIIFDALLFDCATKLHGFSYEVYCEQGIVDGENYIKAGMLPVGGIVASMHVIPDTVYYLSGPAGMISAFEKELFSHGILPEQVLYDRWE